MGKRRLSDVTEEVESVERHPAKRSEGGSDEEQPVEVKPIDEIFKRSSKGKSDRRYFQAVELDGVRYDLEDAVLVTPEERGEKPYVAIIKELKKEKNGPLSVTGQWFYRPEEADKKGGGSWTSFDSRELFYSFHRDEVPAESVMHKCAVHFIPPQKQAPLRTKHPGFIIRHVYDTVEKKLWKLTDKDYEDSKQKEIDLLVQKTRDALGELPNVEGEEVAYGNEPEDVEKPRRHSRRRAVPPLSISRDDPSEPLSKGDGPLTSKADGPSSCRSPGLSSDIADLLRARNSLTGQTARDRWLELIVRNMKSVIESEEPRPNPSVGDGNQPQEDDTSLRSDADTKSSSANDGDEGQKNKTEMVRDEIKWPESAIAAVTALEKVAHELNGSDSHKYNIKMRSMEFNLKKSPVLARRLLKKELEPSTVLHMTPVELKDGVTAAEKQKKTVAPEEGNLQMTEVRCSICSQQEVAVKHIIQVNYGHRYQLECMKCGNSWYASRDSSLTTKTNDVVPTPTVGLAPWATSKFEEVEKELISPREPDRPPGYQEGFSSVQSKPEEMEGTHAQQSRYEDVERALTEHISLQGPGLSTQEQSKVDSQVKTGSEKDENKGEDELVQPDTGKHGSISGSDEK